MALIHHTTATLRVAGDDLDPAEITRLLGREPTLGQTAGQRIFNPDTGIERIARTGLWTLTAEEREPEDIDGQIEEILAGLTTDMAVWASLSERFELDLFCGLFLEQANEGLTIRAYSLKALGLRGIELSLDIYAGDET